MNKTKQFLALLKFQPLANSSIVVMPLMFAMPLFVKYFTGSIGHDYHPSLDLLVSNQYVFFVGVIGVMVLAPEILQSPMATGVWSSGTEFLLTRAVDRHLLLRARIAFFYVLVLVVPLSIFLMALKNPDLQVSEYHEISHRQVLTQIPGSIPAAADAHGKSEEITIPRGNILVESWHLWAYLFAALGTQLLIFVVYPFKYRRFVLIAIYMGLIFAPLLAIRSSAARDERLSSDETLFFSFVAHQPLAWILMALALILAQLWCERRFARMEQ
jgi:hypothetical protein